MEKAEHTPDLPRKYNFQFNGDVDSCLALADLLKAGWGLANCGALQTKEGFHWIRLERWS